MHKYTSLSEIPYGYCHCGCGQKTSIAKWNDKQRGYVKGQPLRYIQHHGRGRSPEQQIESFWSKVNKDGSIPLHMPHLGKCWEWTAGKQYKGYGQFVFNRKIQSVHRISWILAFGSIHENLLVLHKCDNRACVNPEHLFLGTNQDNIDDMVAKNRQARPRGEKYGGHKLTNEEVIAIRKEYEDDGISQAKLGIKYNVTSANIWYVVNYKTWIDGDA